MCAENRPEPQSILGSTTEPVEPEETSVDACPDCLQNGAFGFFHDLAVTENYYILLQNPTKLNFSKLLFGYVPGVYMLHEHLIAHDPGL